MPASKENLARARDDHALVVGIAKYPKLGDNFTANDLDGPVNDARVITDWLVNMAGVPCENVFSLTSDGSGTCMALNGTFIERFPDADSRRPNQSDLMAKLDYLVMRAITATGRPGRIGRRLWVYMAGHGFRSTRNTREVCILPADAYKVQHPKNFCATSWLDWVASSPAFDEVVLWLDCCSYAGYGIPTFGPPDPGQQLRDSPSLRLFVTAAEFGKEAYEAPDGGGIMGGLFTRKLLSALSGAAKPANGTVLTTADLQGFFSNSAGEIRATVRGRTEIQVPKFLENDPMEIVDLGGAPARPQSEIRVDRPQGAVLTVLRDWETPVATATVGAGGTVALSLPAGIYTLLDENGARTPLEIVPEVFAQ